jgi:hypothetical protein
VALRSGCMHALTGGGGASIIGVPVGGRRRSASCCIGTVWKCSCISALMKRTRILDQSSIATSCQSRRMRVSMSQIDNAAAAAAVLLSGMRCQQGRKLINKHEPPRSLSARRVFPRSYAGAAESNGCRQPVDPAAYSWTGIK